MNLSIIDGHNLLFRSYYSSPKTVATPSGTPTNAVCRFCTHLARIARTHPKNHIFVVFDSKTGADAKKDLFPKYKSKKRKPPENLFEQLEIIKRILDLMDIKWCEHPDYEGDDVIASLATYWTKKHGLVSIFSNDYDFIQLMSHRVTLRQSMGRAYVRLTNEMVHEKYGIKPNQYVDLCALHPSKSGNPGIGGITMTDAQDMLTRFDNACNIYRNLRQIQKPVAKKLRDQRDTLMLARKFLTMNRNIPITEIVPYALPETDSLKIRTPTTYYLRLLEL